MFQIYRHDYDYATTWKSGDDYTSSVMDCKSITITCLQVTWSATRSWVTLTRRRGYTLPAGRHSNNNNNNDNNNNTNTITTSDARVWKNARHNTIGGHQLRNALLPLPIVVTVCVRSAKVV